MNPKTLYEWMKDRFMERQPIMNKMTKHNGPSREWITKMAAGEDAVRSTSVGGLAANLGVLPNKVEDKLFDILSERYEAIFNKEYPSVSSQIFKKIITGEIKPNPREKWNELLYSMGIITAGIDEETKKKPAKEGYVCVYDPGNPGCVLVPTELAEKIIVLGYLP